MNPLLERALGGVTCPCSVCGVKAKRYVICGECKKDYCSAACKKKDRKHKCRFEARNMPGNIKDLKRMIEELCPKPSETSVENDDEIM